MSDMLLIDSARLAKAQRGAARITRNRSRKKLQKGVRKVVRNITPLTAMRLRPALVGALAEHGAPAFELVPATRVVELLGLEPVQRAVLTELERRCAPRTPTEAELETVTTLLPSWNGSLVELVKVSRSLS